MIKALIIIKLLLISIFVYGQKEIIKQVDALEFNRLVKQNNGVLLDVRTASEFNNGHIANSGNINFYSLSFRKKLSLLPRDQSIYLYCNTGYRSEKAAEILLKNGYSNVYNLEHGIMEWDLAELPVIVEPGARSDLDNKMETEEYYALIQSDPLVFIDFYAPWCGPCRKMMPLIDSLKVEYYEDIHVVKVNVDASKKLVKHLKLIGVPYLALFNKGKLVYAQNGAATRDELTELFQSNIYKQSLSEIK